MSGIAGILHLSGAPPLRDEAQQLSTGVAHRGRDDKGWFADGPAVLVHRRQAGGGAEAPEPRVNVARVLLLDARCYQPGGNAALEAAWDRDGLDGLRTINADFALASWDRRAKVLSLARDPLGTRPLYWVRKGDKVAFCSEIHPLLGLSWVSRAVALDHVAEYLSFRYVHAPRTLLQDVQAVPPGHVVRIDASGERTERWYRPRWAPPGSRIDEADAARMVDASLRESVGRRLEGPGPVSVLLSGGLDSSAILFHARELGASPGAVTLAFDGDPADETAFAARIAKVMDVQHQVVRVDGSALVDDLWEVTRQFGQPLPSAAAVLQNRLMAELRSDARVVLSGDGGDEVLGGRGMNVLAARLRRNRLLGHLPGPLRRMGRGVAEKAGLTDLAASSNQFGRDRSIGGSRVFHSAERVELLRDPGLVRPGIRRTVLDPFYQEVDTDPINAVLHAWQRGWLPEDSLLRGDRTAAWNGLEVRYPMLDTELVAAARSLPGSAKVVAQGMGFQTKWPLRVAMAERLPQQVLNRPKRSLPNPLGTWLRGAGRGFLLETVETLANDPAGIFLPATVRRLADEHLSGKANHGLKLWTLALFIVWKRSIAG